MKKQSSWGLLIAAGLLEIGWAIALKESEGLTRLLPSIVLLVLLPASFYCFAKALKMMPVGVAYAVFTGMGALGTVLIGMAFLNEPVNAMKLISVLLLVGGIAGLKVSDTSQEGIRGH